MNIYTDIERATHIPCTDENISFVHAPRTKHPGRTKKTPKRIRPKNENLYDVDTSESCDDISTDLFDGHAISSSIREANGGLNYSNEYIERNLRVIQLGDNLPPLQTNGNSKKTTSRNNSEGSEPKLKNGTETYYKDKDKILEKCKLSRNAAISGLVRNNKIPVKYLRIPSVSNLAEAEQTSTTDTKVEDTLSTANIERDKYKMQLVPFPEDPEILVHPLQAYGSIDENYNKDIDFTVPHIGKKNIVTPRQFYFTMDDSEFEFVDKQAKSKFS